MSHGLDTVSSEQLLQALAERGGHPGALARAALLCLRKSQDYNGLNINIHTIDRSNYFPFGALSYAQMIHTKSQRFVNLTKTGDIGVHFEGLEDTALDLINYAGFYIASLEMAE